MIALDVSIIVMTSPYHTFLILNGKHISDKGGKVRNKRNRSLSLKRREKKKEKKKERKNFTKNKVKGNWNSFGCSSPSTIQLLCNRMFEVCSNHLLKDELDIIRNVVIENSIPTCFIGEKIIDNFKVKDFGKQKITLDKRS